MVIHICHHHHHAHSVTSSFFYHLPEKNGENIGGSSNSSQVEKLPNPALATWEKEKGEGGGNYPAVHLPPKKKKREREDRSQLDGGSDSSQVAKLPRPALATCEEEKGEGG